MLKGDAFDKERSHGSLPDALTKGFSNFSFNLFSVDGGWLALQTLHCDTILCLSEHVILPLTTLLQFAMVGLFSTLAQEGVCKAAMQVSHLFKFHNPCLSSPVNLALTVH